MGLTSGESSDKWDMMDSMAHEDKFFVSVRLRPLNEKEITKNDVTDWECINNTIIFKNSDQDHSMLPAVFTFDRVFGPEISTRQVYEEAARKIALSVLSGINSSIFAYGQTSSGKTYTMSGITEYAVADIYDYIDNHPEREYTLKFSALEIYNEIVKDLLSSDGTPRRLLDDPLRGTVIEKLTGVEIRDSSHLKALLSFCQAQRTVGETALNELSSRSHQILCLTVESEPFRGFTTEDSGVLTATVNFVDLAGSERSSQTAAAGTRLKEGSHINRSLLTLGTVIRKLSKGRNEHIPFRDSKLTRILQNSLGGNTRTAIICTLSPAQSQVEQSKSTLVFANCAKKISTNAKVNASMPEKALVKLLRKEIARLENEVRALRSRAASDHSASTENDKELIEKLSKEITQLTHQRDLVHNHEKGSWTDECAASSEATEITNPPLFDVSSRASYLSDKWETASISQIEDLFPMIYDEPFLSDGTSPRLYIEKYFGPLSPPDPGWENFASGNEFECHLDELQSIELDFTKRNSIDGIPLTQKEDNNSGSSSLYPSDEDVSVSDPSVNALGNERGSELAKEKDKISQYDAQTQGQASNVKPEANEEYLQTEGSHNYVGTDCKNEKEENIKDGSKIEQQESCMEVEPEANSDNQQMKDTGRFVDIDFKNDKEDNMERFNQPCKITKQGPSMDELTKEIICNLENQFEDDFMRKNTSPDHATVIENGRQCDYTETAADRSCDQGQETGSASNWYTKFEKQKKEIIELWAACNIPLVYRTYFFLLFKGDPSDTVYMEVELRRLSFMKDKLHGTRAVKDDQFFSEAISTKAMNREREMLSRQMRKKFPGKERKALYQKWGIYLKTKQRRLQLCRKLWTDTTNMEHVKESAAIVAKLVGLKETGNSLKEMIGLSFLQKPDSLRPSSWKRRRHSLPSLI